MPRDIVEADADVADRTAGGDRRGYQLATDSIVSRIHLSAEHSHGYPDVIHGMTWLPVQRGRHKLLEFDEGGMHLHMNKIYSSCQPSIMLLVSAIVVALPVDSGNAECATCVSGAQPRPATMGGVPLRSSTTYRAAPARSRPAPNVGAAAGSAAALFGAALSGAAQGGRSGPASAPPPESCRKKFVGTWYWPGGSTEVYPNGTAQPKGAGLQYWTCSGDTYTLDIVPLAGGAGRWTLTLAADGKTMAGSGTSGTRVPPGGDARPSPSVDKTASNGPASNGSALNCLTPSNRKEGGFWHIANSCPHLILYTYRYKDTLGRIRLASDGYVQGNRDQPIDSQADTRPEPVWACVARSAGCNAAAVKAAAKSP